MVTGWKGKREGIVRQRTGHLEMGGETVEGRQATSIGKPAELRKLRGV